MELKPIDSKEPAPDVGLLISRYFSERRIYRSALSRKLGVRLHTVLNYQKRPSLQTATLWKLSMALKHNFFLDIGHQLPTDFSSNATKDTTSSDRILALEKEKALLEAQLEILKEVMKR